PGFLRLHCGGLLDVEGHKALLLNMKDCTLLDYVYDKGGALGATETAEVAIRLLHQLENLHGIGIVHCDIKVDNVLVDESQCGQFPSLHIIDFGLALNYYEEQRRGRYLVNGKRDLNDLAYMLVQIIGVSNNGAIDGIMQ
ncbi:unnamed protein product, partial [Meganyctiphanes norvegica]